MRRAVPAIGVLLALALVAAACGDDGGSDSSATTAEAGDVVSDVERAVTDASVSSTATGGLNGFGYGYYQLLAAGEEEGFVVSPLSIATLGAVLRAGAVAETADDLNVTFGLPGGQQTDTAYNALDLDLSSLDPTVFRLGTRVYPSTSFPVEADYVETLQRYYSAGVERLDFADPDASAATINDWVAEMTGDRITDLLPPSALTPETALVLVNALYLEARWLLPFDESETIDYPFTRLDGTTVEVPMMHARGRNASYAEGDGWQAVELPYDDDRLQMVIILPEQDRFAEVEADVGPDFVADIDATIQVGGIDLAVPKWTTTYRDDQLIDHLVALGFASANDPNLTLISAVDPPLDQMIHAATIDVDEKGTVASAATSAVLGTGRPPGVAATILVDRPFIYVIRDLTTGAVLFVGRVLDPTATGN